MSENKKETNIPIKEPKDNNNQEMDSDSSQLSLSEEKVKHDDIISSSSDEENNNEKESKEFKLSTKDKELKNQDNIKLLGNKRALSKDHKDSKNQKSNNIKYKNYNNFDSNKKYQPSLDVHLVSYELFCELYNEKEKEKDPNKSINLTEDDYKKLYNEYKANHEHKNIEGFFDNHKKDEWFLEKYNPYDYNQFNYKERNEMCQKKAKIFIEKYKLNKDMMNVEENNLTQKIKLNYIFDLKPEHEYNKNFKLLYTKVDKKNNKLLEIERDFNNIPYTQHIIQKDLEEDGSPYYFYDPNYLTLYSLSGLQKYVQIMSKMNLYKKQPGFISISLSEPDRKNDYKRNFWIMFDSEEHCEKALDNLNDHKSEEFIKSEIIMNPNYNRVKVTPPLFDERLNEDLIGSFKIINILDTYRQILNNPIVTDIKMDKIVMMEKEDRIKYLNLNILYLRKIHGFCYYCLKGFKDERSLSKKCCYIHLRHYIQLGKRENAQSIDINNINISEDELNNAKEFDTYFTEKLNELLHDQEKIDELILLRPKYLMDDKLAIDKINEEENIFINHSSEKVDKDIYKCKICDKKFKAYNYIVTHIKNKHGEKLKDYTDNKVNKFLMEENFYSDKEKFNKSNLIESREYYEELLSEKFNIKNNHNNINSTYDYNFHKKYKDWDDPNNFQSNKNPYKKIKYDDL